LRQGSLKKALNPHRVQEYDPGIKGKDILPKPVDVVVCTDVLEHVEPKALNSVLDHIVKLTGYMAYIVVATRPANMILPSGRNAHLIIQDAEWWTKALARPGWTIESS
jgi:2-polyprenyl-3-methyl-5-hydroxy-6-metoxy-1,4-benzoquinol methylase